jgi:uncharacterized SAM-binding protein YcdF (DUF218 family)
MFDARRWSRARRLRWLRRIAVLAVIAGVAWLGGLAWFASKVPDEETTDRSKTDAIVVLTGGTGRLETGLRLLEEKLARQLFVSGVAHGVDVAALLRVAQRRPDELACCIAVGYRADNTAGNAKETAEWVEKQGFMSIRLVTASYHMPRSLVEFHRAMPNVRIVPHPVFPPRFKGSRWWLWPGTAALLSSEFVKYTIARAGISSGDVARRSWLP